MELSIQIEAAFCREIFKWTYRRINVVGLALRKEWPLHVMPMKIIVNGKTEARFTHDGSILDSNILGGNI